MRGAARLLPATADVDVSWITESVMPFGAYAVGVLVPPVFESYGRILHPAWRGWGRGTPVRWDEVAAWSGRTVHALAEFDRVASPRIDVNTLRPFERRPIDGQLPPEVLEPLGDVLAPHTSSPESCFIGVWEGYGWLKRWDGRTPRLAMPERLHHLFVGPVDAIDEVGWFSPDGRFQREAPSVIWPADRAWFAASDVDQDSTFVGGSKGLIEALVADRRLEVWPVLATDPITAGSDSINQ